MDDARAALGASSRRAASSSSWRPMARSVDSRCFFFACNLLTLRVELRRCHPFGVLSLSFASRGLQTCRLFLARDLLTVRFELRRDQSLGLLAFGFASCGVDARCRF